ncbi:hypothetical protein M432DRAFT_239572 [Thermoascus aurantiacus ATCC 26904]
MEAFNHMGNHLVSDSGPTAGDDTSTVDPDENILNMTRRRRHDDEDDGSEVLDDDDLESTASAPAGGNAKGQKKAEEEKELPPHACA